MFRRFLLLLLIALLPMQGIAASFAVKCPEMAAESAMLADAMPCHAMDAMNGAQSGHEHGDDGMLTGNPLDQGCCHHLAVAIPQSFSLPGATLVRGQAYPVIASSFSDHLPDRLQRPPLSLAI